MSHAPYMSVILSTRPLPHLLSNPEISYVPYLSSNSSKVLICDFYRYQPVKPLGKKRRRKAQTNAQRKLKKAQKTGQGDNDNNGSDDDDAEEEEEQEEVEEPEEVETLEVPESQVDESMEVVESLPGGKKQRGSR
jgi:hypothetical protein